MNTLERFHENYTSLIEWTARALKLMIEDDPSEQSAVRNASVEWERKDRAFQAAMGKIKAKEIIMRLRERTEG